MSRKKPSNARYVDMDIPPSYRVKPISAFTQKVVAMPAAPKRALIYEFDKGETTPDWRRAICCAATAIAAAKRRSPGKRFTMRAFDLDGIRVVGVWRLK